MDGLTPEQEKQVEDYLHRIALSILKPYKVLYVHFDEDFAVIQLRTGDIEVVPFENERYTPKILITADTQGVEFWLVDRGGEDWTIVLYDPKENKLKIYDLDNWDLILSGLKDYEPEVIELSSTTLGGRHPTTQ